MKKKQQKSLVEILFDENNHDNIHLYGEQGDEVEFEQVAIIPWEDKPYAILHPATPMPDVAEDEALVFLIDEENDALILALDEKAVNGVFAVYEEMMKKAQA